MEKQNYIYLNIEKDIIADIYAGKYQNGDKLPSEKEITDSYGVSRMTVHKALKELEAKGFIYAKKGSGYYVNQLVNSRHATLKSFTENAKTARFNLQTKLLYYSQIFAQTEEEKMVAKKLLCNVDEKFHYFERLRFDGNEVKAYEIVWVPFSRIPRMDVNCLSKSFYSFVENELNLTIKGGNSIIKVEMSNEKLNRIFKCSESKPFIRVDEITFLDSGLPFEYSISYFNGETTEIEVYRDRQK